MARKIAAIGLVLIRCGALDMNIKAPPLDLVVIGFLADADEAIIVACIDFLALDFDAFVLAPINKVLDSLDFLI
jgi:hypothetical protein